MKREIKFRMWNPLPGKMIYNEAVVIECLKQQIFFGSTDPQHIPKYDHEGEYGAVFMQFTGLRDKDGVEVYDGDIVIDAGGNKGKVEWMQDHCQFIILFDGAAEEIGSWGTVIGNIYQHPHLLSGKEAGDK